MKELFNVPLKSNVLRTKKRRFDLDLPVYTFKEEGEGRRVLVIVDRVPNDDIEAGELFRASAAGSIVEKIVYDADAEVGNQIEEVAFINYHEFRIHDIDSAMRSAAEADFTLRIEKFIRNFKPDVIIAMGREVINTLFDYTPQTGTTDPARYFGRLVPFPKKLTGKDTQIIYTLGLGDFCPDIRFDRREEDTKRLQSLASLSGIVLRHFTYAFAGRNIHNISSSPFKVEYVNSIPLFKRLMEHIKNTENVVAIDTETEGLARLDNKLLSIQFAAEHRDRPQKPHNQIAWFLPFDHPDAPWTNQQRNYIVEKLKHYFEFGSSHSLIMQNAKFDLTQIASQIGVRYFNHKIYGVDNGEYALEENLKFLSEKSMGHLGISAYGLNGITARYGWPEAYDDTGVDKSKRTGFHKMEAKEFLLYACTDVIGPLRLRRAQIKRAKYEGHDPEIFERAVTGILSDMEHVFSEMERTGHNIDVAYLNDAIRPNGVIDRMRESNLKKYKKSKAARRVNERLLQRRGAPQKTLFGGNSVGDGQKPWEFSIRKVEHQQALFFEELGIAPINTRKDGGGSINKSFLEKYGSLDEEGEPKPGYVKEVGWYAEMKKYDTLMTNFVRPVNRQIMADPDAVIDGRIRSNFNFRHIITGRSGSSRDAKRDIGINFQNIPVHGYPAKAVKRLFTTPERFIYIKVDFGAHEVRNWANISGDDVLSGTFATALKLKRRFIIETDPENLERIIALLKTDGDIHIANVRLFFKKNVDKKHPLRQQVKAVVFGVIYGKSGFSLAKDLNIEDQEAEDLIEKLFTTFPEGGKWLTETIKKGRADFIIETPFGLKRHLWGYMHPDEAIKRAMDRRGPNSVIQGPSSQMGFIAGRNLQNLKWENFIKKGYQYPLRHDNSVHDSLELEDMIRTLPVSIYLAEHAMTTQVARVCREMYDFKLKIDLDVEFEIGATLSDMTTWNNKFSELPAIVEAKLKWKRDTFGEKTSKTEWRAFMNNCELVSSLRRKEIIMDLKSKKYPSENMLIDDHFIASLDLLKER